ncbi:hypothetical protein PHYSODRAFT_319107 [Phytophthora sojae]|uniref:Uncharacterized protein n=1 Tax=Phytophthora sojae (strain P6497) TaxID=1094619 RepID=G5A950_PHYSP|nr:hypothetical protein PHYSODRAFT_319107 [Phytophthora sojae]EGZ08426.1 hypothetical protein PHYSODRAFT_319107 [Phytophthora sojae]|eukprot:XP_009536598.1 hypothetical protein PHYSODRAFT_319107 [Phytophthora sojae]
MANSSQRMALSTNKNKNWRANYLRALNIFTPDLAPSTRGRHVSANGDGRRTAAQQANGRSETTTSRRRTVAAPSASTDEPTRRAVSGNNSRGRSSVSASVSASTSARHSSSRSGSSSRSRRGTSPSDDKTSSYVFGLRSHLFRARKLATRSDMMVVDRVSAPIEIPIGTSATSPTAIPSRTDKLLDRRDSESHRRRGSSHDFQNSTDKQAMVQLLSWEEPSVMLGNGGWPLESEKRNSNNNGMSAGLAIPMSRNDGGRTRRSSRPYSGPDGIAEECEDTDDDDADGLTNTEDDDDDDIFKMEFEGEGGDSKAKNVFRSKHASSDRRRVGLRQRVPGGFDDFDDEEDDVVTPLSASFVPPHQMVERGCFSLGLRDELKRKPGVHI